MRLHDSLASHAIVAALPLIIAQSLSAQVSRTTEDGTGADTFLANDSNTGPTSVRGANTVMNMRRFDGTRSRQPLFRFDIGSLSSGANLTGATLSLTITRSSNRTRTANVYGLIDEALDSWPESTTSYSNAPGASAATAGNYSFSIYDAVNNPTGKYRLLGSMSFPSAASTTPIVSNTTSLNLDTFLDEDTNGLVTFLIIPQTTDSTADWDIAAKEHATSAPPLLNLPNVQIDNDSDNLSDAWETLYFANWPTPGQADPFRFVGTDDPDLDGVDNETEESAGSNPTLAASIPGDIDGDGLDDSWENLYFGNLNQTGSGDPDGDLYTNEEEETAGTAPNDKFDFIASGDSDSLNDRWELAFFGDLDETDTDSDGDSYINSEEYADGTNPANILSSFDSDLDNLADGWEIFHFIESGESASNPADVTTILARQTGSDDPDLDTFTNDAEEIAGSDPNLAASVPGDTDGDGLLDAWETYWTGNQTTLSGTATDSDGDGFTNAQEFTAGSNPDNINSTPSDMNGNGTPDANESPKPYTVDADTLHLWHLDEISPPFADAVNPDFNLQGMFNGANGWAPGLSGFGTGVSTNSGSGNNRGIVTFTPTANDSSVTADTSSAASFFEWHGVDGAFTIEGLARFDTTTNLSGHIVSMDGDGSLTQDRVFQFRIAQIGGVPHLQFQRLNGAAVAYSSPIPLAGLHGLNTSDWFHLAVTYNGAENTAGNLRLFWTRIAPGNTAANEIGAHQLPADFANQQGDLSIGNEARGTESAEYLPGSLDEIRISSVARGADQFLMTTPRPPASLVWQGGTNGDAWDVALSGNWLNSAATDTFRTGDSVSFTNAGSANSNILLVSSLMPASVAVNSSADYTFSGSGTISGATGLEKSGTGNLTLATANGYSGDTIINAGKITLGVAGAIPSGASAGNVTLSGGTVDLNGFSATFNEFSGTGTVDSTSGTAPTFTLSNFSDSTFSGSFQNTAGSLTLVKGGFGLLTLSGNSTHSGGTFIGINNTGTRVGTIRAVSSQALGSGPVTIGSGGNDASATLEVDGGITLANAITLPGRNNSSLILDNVSGNNSLTGAFTLTTGGTEYSIGSAAGTLTLGSAGNPIIAAIPNSATRNLNLGGAGSGIIAGDLNLTNGTLNMQINKSGAGTWNVAGALVFTGNTTVTEGILSIATDDVFDDNSTVTLASNSSLNLTHSGTDQVGALIINNINQPDGVYTFGTGKLRVGNPPAGYADWASTHAPTGNPDDDFDGDGVANAVEYVLGGTKDSQDSNKLPTLATSGGNLVLTFVRDQLSIDGSTTVQIQVGTNLIDWPLGSTYNVPDAAATASPGVSVIKDSPTSGKDTVILSISQAPDSQKFARLKVTAAP